MTIKSAVKQVQLTIASLMTWTFIQGHKYASNLTNFLLAISQKIFKLLHATLHR